MIKIDTPTNIKRLTLCYSREVIDQYCTFQEVDVLHITANIDSYITRFFSPEEIEFEGLDSEEVEFGCPVPRAFEVDEDNPYLTAIDGVLFSKDKKTLIAFPKRDKKYKYSIPEGVTCIGHEAFRQQWYLTSIHIPDSVKIIERSAFCHCWSLKELTLPLSLESKWNDPLSECISLTRIDISPDNKTYAIVDGVLFSKDMKKLHMYPIKKKGTLYKIPEGVEIIGESAFCSAENLQRVILPSTLQDMGACSFSFCKNLKDVDGLPEWFLLGMSLNKKDLKKMGIREIVPVHYFWFSPCLKKINAMRKQVRFDYKNKEQS